MDQPETTPDRVPPDSEAIGLVQPRRCTVLAAVAVTRSTEKPPSSKPYVAGQVIGAEVVVRRTRKETREYEVR